MKIAIYVEGGGPTSRTQDLIRRGFSEFLRSAVRAARMCRGYVRPIVCGGRRQAYDKFCDALVNDPDVFNVLLVDSEDPVTVPSPWVHLRNRPGDGWARPPQASDDHCQMMVICMEAWFLADPNGLQRHFKADFDTNALPPVNQAETRSKADIADSLRRATKNTKAQGYQKIRDGAKLLAIVDPAKVRQHCPWCDRLFQTLGQALGVPI